MFVIFGVETWEGVNRLPQQFTVDSLALDYTEADNVCRDKVADFFQSCIGILDIHDIKVEINPLPTMLNLLTRVGMVDTIGGIGDCQMSVYAIKVA